MEYEQNGQDRAQYGEQLLGHLSRRLNCKGMNARRLYEYRQFYSAYPYLGGEVAAYLQSSYGAEKLRLLTAELQSHDNQSDEILRLPTAILPQVSQTATLEPWQTPPAKLFHRIPATQLIMLSSIKEPLKRAFYEQETIRGTWTVKELDRQISSLYFERSGLSKDKAALQRYVSRQSEGLQPAHIVRDPMTLEFLGIPQQQVVTETRLETAILDHLQRFLLELGQGFCFEARQHRILIDQDYFKADLIFYHRILHCHVIIDLKVDRYRHEYASQLNTYKNYYRREMMEPGDNPPIGLLLCTDYGETLVKYSTEGLEQIYVTKYQLCLPSEETIRQYLLDNIDPAQYNDDESETK